MQEDKPAILQRMDTPPREPMFHWNRVFYFAAMCVMLYFMYVGIMQTFFWTTPPEYRYNPNTQKLEKVSLPAPVADMPARPSV